MTPAAPRAKSLALALPGGVAPVATTSALWLRPRGARAVLVFAHGAGADMRHAFMEATAERLAERGIATLRFRFPYMERQHGPDDPERRSAGQAGATGGRRPPDPAPVLIATLRAAVDAARRRARGLPLFAGGKSMGGRMASLAAAEGGLPSVRGLVFFGFPLHAAGRPSTERAEPLRAVDVPMLFLQGTRDPLAELGRMRGICRRLGARATLHVVDGGDHGFHVPRRSGRTDAEALDEIADAVQAWIGEAGRKP